MAGGGPVVCISTMFLLFGSLMCDRGMYDVNDPYSEKNQIKMMKWNDHRSSCRKVNNSLRKLQALFDRVEIQIAKLPVDSIDQFELWMTQLQSIFIGIAIHVAAFDLN